MAHHRFVPETYHTAIGAHDPVLHVASGDTITTTTVDAGGSDATGQPVTPGGNPQTGPFYVESAEPGDTLAVTFDKLAPNRKIGFTSGVIAANVLDLGYRPEFDDDRNRLEWEIDFEDNTATPIGFEDLPIGRLRIPLRPMVGCFGVAPPRGQAISTATSDTHGGNMDYKEFVQGVTVYFPVFVDGGLFPHRRRPRRAGRRRNRRHRDRNLLRCHLHPAPLQGQNHPLAAGDQRNPRNGRRKRAPARPGNPTRHHRTDPLPPDDYGLDARSIHILMGQAVEYDVGNVYDPAYTMVCKMSRKTLESIGA